MDWQLASSSRLQPPYRCRSLQSNGRNDGQAKRQGQLRIEPAIDDDLHRNALDDLDVVAGRVLRWKGGELGPGAALHTFNMAAQPQRGIGIDSDRDVLPWAHPIELRLLEVGGNPDLWRDDREDGRADLQIVAPLHVALGDPAIPRGTHGGVGEIELRL